MLESSQEAVVVAPMSPEVARPSSNRYAKSTPERADYDLRRNELPLLELLAEGHTSKTAATELHVTPSTINFHLQNIYAASVHYKTEVVVKALRSRSFSPLLKFNYTDHYAH